MRTETTSRTLYQFDELSERAQGIALQRVSAAISADVDYGHVYDMAADAADLMGLDIRQTRRTRRDNTHYYAPTIYWSGFWSQGDGACFEGQYAYKPGSVAAIKKEFPTDTELHRIATELQRIQRPFFYKLQAYTKQRGRYQHSGCMSVDVSYDGDHKFFEQAESGLTQVLRDFADWIYARLEAEYDYQTSEESARECIAANEYEFTEEGELA